MEIWLGASLVLLVVGTVTILVGLRRRREAHELRELRRSALAKLAVTAEHVAVAPIPAPIRHLAPRRRTVDLDAYIAAAFRDNEPAPPGIEPSDEALTNVSMPSLKKQMEIQARSRLARGSLPPAFERDARDVPRVPRAREVSLDKLFDDFDLEDQSEPAPLH